MQSLATRLALAAVFLVASAQVADAAMIRGTATFQVEYYGGGEDGVEYDPPLPGPGFFELRSLPFNPDVVDEDPSPPVEFDVLDFSFSFAGRSWDETDVPICECYFTADGDPRYIDLAFDDDEVSWLLSWSFEDGNFGFAFYDGELDLSGTSENGIVSGSGDFNFFVVPEPGSLGLLLLGLAAGAAVARRSRVRPAGARAAPRSPRPTAGCRPTG